VDDARHARFGYNFVHRVELNMNGVNRSASQLFPLIIMLNKQFIPAAIPSRRARFLAGSKSAMPLKENDFSSPVTSH